MLCACGWGRAVAISDKRFEIDNFSKAATRQVRAVFYVFLDYAHKRRLCFHFMALLRLRDLIILFDSASEDDSRITFSHISSARKAQTAHTAEEERWMM